MSLNLPLPDSIQKFINEQVAIGGYSNAAEYILHLIRQEQVRSARVESLLLAGLDSGNSLEITMIGGSKNALSWCRNLTDSSDERSISAVA